ncbi:hypothetical protein DL98DRAFT_520937 [Cadophora sp. DSE1049]|nr:hypothetical protein DL98DRAFT_520937 [Cadophora sp. DSE1049]
MNKLDPRPIPRFPAVDYSKTTGLLYADLMRWCLAGGEISSNDTLVFSQNVQRALEYPFPGTPATRYAELEGHDPEETFPVLFTEEKCSEIVSAVGPLERVDYSYRDRSFRWTDVSPHAELRTCALDIDLSEAESFRCMLKTQQDDGVDMDVIDHDLLEKIHVELLGTFRRFQTSTGWWYVGPPDIRKGDVIDQDSMLLLRHYNPGNEIAIVGRGVKYDPRGLKMKNTNAQGELDLTKFVPVGKRPVEAFEPFPGE